MVVEQVKVSDISGKRIPESSVARIVVFEHPDLDGPPVELDADSTETARIQNGRLRIVNLKIVEPGNPDGRRVMLDVDSFSKLFKGDLSAARRVGSNGPPSPATKARPSTSGRRTRQSRQVTQKPVARGEKYSSPSLAGVLHRGRVTETEQLFVREHLDQANENRRRANQPPIDPQDPKEKRRYGF